MDYSELIKHYVAAKSTLLLKSKCMLSISSHYYFSWSAMVWWLTCFARAPLPPEL